MHIIMGMIVGTLLAEYVLIPIVHRYRYEMDYQNLLGLEKEYTPNIDRGFNYILGAVVYYVISITLHP